MNQDRLDRWIGLGANVGVVLGLLLLIFQLHQNRSMMRAQTRNEMAMGIVTLLSMPSNNAQLARPSFSPQFASEMDSLIPRKC
jgi:hypothetical protein